MEVFDHMDVVRTRWFVHGDVSDCGLIYSTRADLFLAFDDDHWLESEEEVNEHWYYRSLSKLFDIQAWSKDWSDRWYRPATALNLVRYEMAKESDFTDLL